MMENFVGDCQVEVADIQLGLTFPLLVLYPTTTPSQTEQLGPYQLELAREAPLQEGLFPLVIISHGKGSTPLVYRTLAHYLARHGFVVGLPEHPFNNRQDNAWDGTVQNLKARPRHLQLAISDLFGHPKFATALKPGAVALIGHSMGGYTALALAGGVPTAFPWESPDSQAQLLKTVVDGRVKALVLLAPATPWFGAAGALDAVTVPILLFTAAQDEHTTFEHAQLVLNGVPDKSNIEHRIVPNAGHFAFLSPFPDAMKSPAFPPSQDPPSFDRAQFHEELNADILAFLQREIG